MNYKKPLIFLGAIGLLVVAILSLSPDFLTSYVPIETAKKDAGKLVQIIGKVDTTRPENHKESVFFFSIIDEKNGRADIAYKGVKPANFDRADQIVCIGKFNSKENMFMAEKLLVKCPSKYENKYKDGDK